MNILLDYDGTIHDTLGVYAAGFRKAYAYLTDKGLASPKDFTDRDISKWLGFSPKEMWDTFMPNLASSEKEICTGIIGETMKELISAGEDSLYEGALETLKFLKDKGHTLIFLSNCTHEYMENNRKQFELDRFYSGFYCSEDYGYAEKPVIFSSIIKDFPGEYLIVGDRFKDIEIGQIHGIDTVGCLYGFGSEAELEPATYKIKSIEKLKEAVKHFR